ncbi:undecaprenyl-diphosphate phosphatase [uncultured Umboniibacter sp.]|uniref:undecaprenyl-diphosphate phosphatase n=1 Tax=uncultured Umboniibacter sp. TaxID=1798917 RepID=UPI0026078112|nr:undecaprenyl-diphosphate phosphatase [uncultured Umboniibacter sp.]
MDLFHAFLLAVIQGLTEFLPISSSAHLILPTAIFGWPDQGLAFDVAVHVGTLMAVMIHFRVEVVRFTRAWFGWFSGVRSPDSTFAWMILFATIPAVIVGRLLNDFVELYLRSGWIIAGTTILFGALLWYADVIGRRIRTRDELTPRHMFWIAVAQALALVPGVSRSGITMTTALFLGYSRRAAASISFLLSIPLIAAAGSYKASELLAAPSIDWIPVLFGLVISFISAFVCIKLFMRWLDQLGMLPFVIYRFALGALLIVVLI